MKKNLRNFEKKLRNFEKNFLLQIHRFESILLDYRELLVTLNREEIYTLETCLCRAEEPSTIMKEPPADISAIEDYDIPVMHDYVEKLCRSLPSLAKGSTLGTFSMPDDSSRAEES